MTKLNAAAVQDTLANLSSGLDGAYAGIVNRIHQQSEDDRQLAWRALSWVFNAKTPLRPSELQEALTVEPDATMIDPGRQTEMDFISSVCAGLIVVNEADDKVRLIHYPTQTYLQSAQNTLFPHAQKEITLTCLTYMRLTLNNVFGELEQQPWRLFSRNPFLNYAVGYCLVHACGSPETEIQDKILEFLGDFSEWRRLWNRNRWRENQLPPNKLLIALTFGLEIISSHILRQDGPGKSLQEAASRGVTDAVWFLLKNVENEGGTFINAEEGQYGSALGAAAWNGHESVVKLLMEHGANVNGRSGEYGSALQAAVWKGHKAIVQLLLQHGADMNPKAGEHGSPLQLAFQQEHGPIIRLLLKHGAGVDEKAATELQQYLWDCSPGIDKLSSMLQAASWMGHESMVRLPFEHGANINARQRYGSALGEASRQGHAVIVKLLIEHGAEVNAGGANQDSALKLASRRGHVAVVKLLLEHGADVNTPLAGCLNHSALWEACSQKHEAIVQLLIEHGADLNAKDWLYGSAMQFASWQGNEGIVRLLLENGADVNVQGGLRGSALQAASSQGHVAVSNSYLNTALKSRLKVGRAAVP